MDSGTYPPTLSSETIGSEVVQWRGHRLGSQWARTIGKGETKTSLNPSNARELVKFTISQETVQTALSLAQTCFHQVPFLSVQEKSKLLKAFSDAFQKKKKEIVIASRVEGGKHAWEAELEVEKSAAYLREVSARADDIYETLLSPAHLGQNRQAYSLESTGPVAAYLSFSSPVSSFVSYLSAAILSGNPIIFFASAQSAQTSLLLAALEEECSAPLGYFGLLFSGFDVFKQALKDPRLSSALYAGSKENGDALRKQSRPSLQLILEYGGKNPILVHSSAQIEDAVQETLLGLCQSAGQLCSSTSRAFVYRSLLNDYKSALAEAVSQMFIGPADEQNSPSSSKPVSMGPLYSRKSLEKFLRFQTMARREAQQTISWGKVYEGAPYDGHYVVPGIHLIERLDPLSPYQRNVLFSPDLAIYPYDKLEEAFAGIHTAETLHSLSFIGDPSVILERRHQIKVPHIIVNASTIESGIPFLAARSMYSHHLYNAAALALHLSFPQLVAVPKTGIA
ncbi:MAG: aldehyde dehydrogenase family protein [Oligoflexales bacterium]|nr:aldehyde dehydrogenase family protein [Oligoflexales bacterium]